RLLAAGIVGWFAIQTLINLGGATGVLPITGVPLPFISFGGSSLVVSLGAVGVLLSIGRAGVTAVREPRRPPAPALDSRPRRRRVRERPGGPRGAAPPRPHRASRAERRPRSCQPSTVPHLRRRGPELPRRPALDATPGSDGGHRQSGARGDPAGACGAGSAC